MREYRRNESVGPFFMRGWINRTLTGGAIASQIAAVGIALNSFQQEPAITIPYPEPSTRSINSIEQPGASLTDKLVAELLNPKSPLTIEAQERFDRDGLIIESVTECSGADSQRGFLHNATLRQAPFTIAKAIREIERGQQFTAPIEVAINSITGKTPLSVWMAQINPTNPSGLDWVAKSDGITQYAINIWPKSNISCRTSKLPNYTKVTPPGQIK